MNFIEQIFGIAPDAGDGSFEMLLFLISIAAIVLITLYRRGVFSSLCPRHDTVKRSPGYVRIAARSLTGHPMPVDGGYMAQ